MLWAGIYKIEFKPICENENRWWVKVDLRKSGKVEIISIRNDKFGKNINEKNIFWWMTNNPFVLPFFKWYKK